jgi:hypothetical protein
MLQSSRASVVAKTMVSSLDHKGVFHVFGYSYLRESIGLTFDALRAGTKLAKRTTEARGFVDRRTCTDPIQEPSEPYRRIV